MAIFTFDDLATFNPDLELTKETFNAVLNKVMNIIGGKLAKPTLEPKAYVSRKILSHFDYTFRPVYKPLLSVESVAVRYSQNNGFRPTGLIELSPEQYEVDLEFHEVVLTGEQPFTGNREITLKYTSGFNETIDLIPLKTAIAQGISYVTSPTFEGIKSEAIAGEITVSYNTTSREVLSEFDSIIAPLLIWKSDVY